MARALAFIPEQPGGVTYVRFFLPFAHLGQFGHELVLLPPRVELARRDGRWQLPDPLLDGIDVALFAQLVGLRCPHEVPLRELLLDLVAQLRERGIAIVYSTDDDVRLVPADNPNAAEIAAQNAATQAVAEQADALITTTAELAERLARPGQAVFVVPNAIDPALWPRRPRTSGEWRVGWSGSGSHLDDLLLAARAVRELAARQPIHFVVQGVIGSPLPEFAAGLRGRLADYDAASRPIAERILELVGVLDRVRWTSVPFVELDAHRRTLAQLDLEIGLCPLLDTPFNRAKSALKFYEYAAVDTLTLASSVPPYVGEVSLLVDNDPQAWAGALEHWLRRGPERTRELEKQRAFVFGERSIARIAPLWAAALDAICRLR